MQFSKSYLDLWSLTEEYFRYIKSGIFLSRTQKKIFIVLASYYPISMTEEEIAQVMLYNNMEEQTDVQLDFALYGLLDRIDMLKQLRLN